MWKTPISVLQELAVQKKLSLPDYEYSGSGQPHCMSFICNVKVGCERATGTGTTKKDAKHNAASKLLETFGVKMDNAQGMSNICLLPTKTRRDVPIINFVGRLNEFCSGYKYPQASYTDRPTLHNAQFCIICTFLEFMTEGYGSSKKESKQDAAKKMLMLIKDKDIGYSPVADTSQLNVHLDQNNEKFDKVLQTYTDIMKNLHITNPSLVNNNNIMEMPKKRVFISNWDDLIDYMNKQGWRHEVTVFQSSPLMLSLKINDHTLIDFGRTREEIYRKFVTNVVQMVAEGTDFCGPLINL